MRHHELMRSYLVLFAGYCALMSVVMGAVVMAVAAVFGGAATWGVTLLAPMFAASAAGSRFIADPRPAAEPARTMVLDEPVFRHLARRSGGGGWDCTCSYVVLPTRGHGRDICKIALDRDGGGWAGGAGGELRRHLHRLRVVHQQAVCGGAEATGATGRATWR